MSEHWRAKLTVSCLIALALLMTSDSRHILLGAFFGWLAWLLAMDAINDKSQWKRIAERRGREGQEQPPQ